MTASHPLCPASLPPLVAVAHGSRVPEAPRTVTGLLALVRSLRPGLRVVLGHVELNEPPLPDALDALPAGDAILVPLLFGRGHHVKHDLPRAAAGAAHLSVRIAAPLGPHPLLAEALAGRLAETGWTGAGRPDGGVVLAAAGSRDPESEAGARGTAALLSARLGGTPVVPAYASAAEPTVPGAVAALRAAGRRNIALASCFAAPGRFAAHCAEAVPALPAARPLGAHPALARLVLHRYDEARARAGAPALHPSRGGLARAS
ncbi:sirohydrochlorin chelatase [Streptomyces sp. TRM43335]|uniref:Sirohydrochlorin chelatase n=1 Tax=Streptomyces taklimakanensis TaxID=2569853 RepID=A0A6G2BAL6_9ACTN|nr:sirohydrochlorin chelatase [Streptomyces taklimakanensis]MTE18942.1 sirohydrochlorin chelatase [Streptomyces taklimakanensis]